jgi:hypothetical protein
MPLQAEMSAPGRNATDPNPTRSGRFELMPLKAGNEVEILRIFDLQ